eukprot:5025919-Pyramimonas_sp.AAC.1
MLHRLTAMGVDSFCPGTVEEEDEGGRRVELHFDPGVHEAFLSLEEEASCDCVASLPRKAELRIYAAAKAAVINRDADVLPDEEVS